MDITKLKAIRSALDEIIGADEPKPVPQIGGNIYAGAKPEGPWDPAWPGYQPGDANQFMLRKYARQAKEADWNKYIKDRHIAPRFPDSAYVEKEEKLD